MRRSIGPRPRGEMDGIFYVLTQFLPGFAEGCIYHAERIVAAFAEHHSMPNMLRPPSVMTKRTTHNNLWAKWSAHETSSPFIAIIRTTGMII
jgi:hypothetical protein